MSSPSSNQVTLDWVVRVCSKQNELEPEGYSIFIFLGTAPDDAKEWGQADSLVGTSEVLAGYSGRRDKLVEGFVYLNQALARSPLSSLDPNVVLPYLKENLHWGVSQYMEKVDYENRLQSLEVTVGCTQMETKPGDKTPRAGKAQWYYEITAGKAGGYHEDKL